MSSFWNNRISFSIFGESQASAVGVTIENLPAGEYINADELASFMARRAIKSGLCPSSKGEAAMPHILSGIFNNRTTGKPLFAYLQNIPENVKKDRLADPNFRGGNADYTGTVRYKGFEDVKNAASFNSKLTAPLCFTGAVCGQILERRGIYTGAHVYQIHNIKDNPFDPVAISRDAIRSIRIKNFPVINDRKGWLMLEDIKKASEMGETLGGIIECAVINVPAGVGSPIFDGIENNIAQLVFGIPGVKGIEFGSGFRSAQMVGSQNSDSFYVDAHGHSVTRTNNHGGILGGISSGMPITLNIAFQPMDKSYESYDPCLVPSSVACVEAAVNIAVLNHMIDYPNFC